jgi:hypothetical protein
MEYADKKAQRIQGYKRQASSVLGTIGDAKKLVGYGTVGFGGLLSSIPMTDARDLNAKLTTIKANLGFDRLQEMRESSPTGGALGQVAVQELVALQSTVESLDQLQSVSQMQGALDKIEKHYRNWMKTLEAAQPGGGAQTKAKPPALGDRRGGYIYKGGPPNDPKSWEKAK